MNLLERIKQPTVYRWVMVGIASIIVGTGLGGLFSISIFLKPISAQFAWERGDTAFAYSAAAGMNGLSGILMGYLADRYSTRPIVFTGAVTLASGFILLSMIDSLWQFYLIYGVFLGAFGLAAFLTPLVTNVGFWFEKNPGLALGILLAGQSVGGALVPPLARWLLANYGWREAYYMMGIGALILLVPLALMVREPPGMKSSKAASKQGGGTFGRKLHIGISARSLLSVLCCGIILCCITMSIPIIHVVSLATDLGISGKDAAGALTVMMVSSVFGRVGVGKLAELIGPIQALLVSSFAQTVMIFWYTQVPTIAGFYLVGVAFGLGYGGVIPAYAIIIRTYIPSHLIGQSTGLVFFFGNIGMASGGFLGGYLFDITENYLLSFSSGAVSGLLNIIVVGTLLLVIRGRMSLSPGPEPVGGSIKERDFSMEADQAICLRRRAR